MFYFQNIVLSDYGKQREFDFELTTKWFPTIEKKTKTKNSIIELRIIYSNKDYKLHI